MARWREPYNYSEVIEVIEPKRLFNLKMKYEPGMGVLHVFYNGVLATLGEMYYEKNSYAIELMFDPFPGDKIICVYQKLW